MCKLSTFMLVFTSLYMALSGNFMLKSELDNALTLEALPKFAFRSYASSLSTAIKHNQALLNNCNELQ